MEEIEEFLWVEGTLATLVGFLEVDRSKGRRGNANNHLKKLFKDLVRNFDVERLNQQSPTLSFTQRVRPIPIR